jgi:hypothetical protein
LIPLFKIGNTLTIAMSDPLNILAIDEAKLKSGYEIEPPQFNKQVQHLGKNLDMRYPECYGKKL